ncbi:5963_t:CDS:2 [Funneliformis geosporum]|uniref:3607_t:CDS:1 n=1 Tax=Funneliformis geosporum TaxID=1117311 RepID=A0A9W4SSI7_9GLOM|nr:3607_t:CDS:2 [Funneliformis geosporum]CAI2187871.1 5963_t:CDS:2 [Funneliformis geosporum]
MEDDFFINTSQPSPPFSSFGASYIRNWQVEGACAQLNLSKIQFNEFKEHADDCIKPPNSSIGKCAPPKFRYRYLKESIVLYLLYNGQLFIPLEALSGIKKVKSREIKLILKEGEKDLIEYKLNNSYSNGKKLVIRENLREALFIFLRFHKDVSTKEVDIVGLHIDYLINKKNNSRTPEGEIVQRSSWGSNWGLFNNERNESFIQSNDEMVIKFHINDEIRIFLFDGHSQYQEIKEHIEKIFCLETIKKLKYKDDDGEFIIMSSQEEFYTAFSLYSKSIILKLNSMRRHLITHDKSSEGKSGITFDVHSESYSVDGCLEEEQQELTTFRPKTNVEQPFKYYLCFDVEATCVKGGGFNYMNEIIEFPILLLDSKSFDIVDIFHSYVKPSKNSILSDFCRELTGISQSTIDASPLFPEMLDKFQEFMHRHKLFYENSCAFITDGPWDIRDFITKQCSISKIPRPSYFSLPWVDIRSLYSEYYNCGKCNIIRMLEIYGLKFEGREHSGIDDAKNLVRIAKKMWEDGAIFETNRCLQASIHRSRRHKRGRGCKKVI